jgi:hypothetical protein
MGAALGRQRSGSLAEQTPNLTALGAAIVEQVAHSRLALEEVVDRTHMVERGQKVIYHHADGNQDHDAIVIGPTQPLHGLKAWGIFLPNHQLVHGYRCVSEGARRPAGTPYREEAHRPVNSESGDLDVRGATGGTPAKTASRWPARAR